MIPTPFQSLKTLRVSRQDFTSISEELKQDDLILLLTVYLSVMTRIIEPGPRRASPGRSERCLRKNGKGHGVDVFWEKIIRHVCIYIYTLWLFNIAMENGPFIDGLPLTNGDFPWLC